MLLASDIRSRLRRGRPPEARPDGRPARVEWVLLVLFSGLSLTVLAAGVVDLSRGAVRTCW
jgi:hypothetical protein